MFQNVEVASEIRSDPKLDDGVELATRTLGRMVGDSSRLLRIRWDKAIDERNRPLARMKLQDWTGEVEASFSHRDLTDESALRDKFYKIYGDLLQIRSHKQLDELLGGAAAGENQ
jgi:hypothetical protein